MTGVGLSLTKQEFYSMTSINGIPRLELIVMGYGFLTTYVWVFSLRDPMSSIEFASGVEDTDCRQIVRGVLLF